MAKPILIIKVPEECIEENESLEVLQRTADSISDEIKDDYHVLVTHTSETDPKFEVYYEKDFDEVKYEELKQIILDSVDKK